VSSFQTDRNRFTFGENWARFLRVLNEDRILQAEESLRTMLQVNTLQGLSFLDVGSGSGLFSLAAARLGAARIHSFDYGLGKYDVVYSWGVLHHTGAMWEAMDNILPLVTGGGQLFISIYNDQGTKSVFWHTVKRKYNELPSWLRLPYAIEKHRGTIGRFTRKNVACPAGTISWTGSVATLTKWPLQRQSFVSAEIEVLFWRN
jgi:hypothetical protein